MTWRTKSLDEMYFSQAFSLYHLFFYNTSPNRNMKNWSSLSQKMSIDGGFCYNYKIVFPPPLPPVFYQKYSGYEWKDDPANILQDLWKAPLSCL